MSSIILAIGMFSVCVGLYGKYLEYAVESYMGCE